MKIVSFIGCLALVLSVGCGDKKEIARLQQVVEENKQRETELGAEQARLETALQRVNTLQAAERESLKKQLQKQKAAVQQKKESLQSLEQKKAQLNDEVLGNDQITLVNNKSIEGVVQKFEAGIWHIEMKSGEIKKGSAKSIKKIRFAQP